MTAKKPYGLLLLLILTIALGACVSRPVDAPEGTSAAPAHATLAPSTPVAPGASTVSSESGSPTPPAVPASPDVTVIPAEEEDCMAGCHIPDPNEFIGAGAMPQPASHIGRTTCLTCHATLAQPAMPATHTGRLDPSCTVCHK
jgi:hypothetical protein